MAYFIFFKSLNRVDCFAFFPTLSCAYLEDRLDFSIGFDSIGAYHGAELPYVFDRHDSWLPTESVDRTLTRLMLDYWQGFITEGDPNSSDLMVWPPWQSGDHQAVIFSEESSVMPHPDVEFCSVFSDS